MEENIVEPTKLIKDVDLGDDKSLKLKLSEKIAVICGNAPNTFHYQMIQTYLLFFYTDFMKINPAFIAVPLYKLLGRGDDAKGFSSLMLIAAVFTVLVSIYQAYRIKERYLVEAKKDEKSPSLNITV